jgi:hypothetical protein
MILGAPISVAQFLLWNLLPVTLGNFLAGALFTGVALYLTYASALRFTASATSIPATAQSEPQAVFATSPTLNPM